MCCQQMMDDRQICFNSSDRLSSGVLATNSERQQVVPADDAVGNQLFFSHLLGELLVLAVKHCLQELVGTLQFVELFLDGQTEERGQTAGTAEGQAIYHCQADR